MCQVIQNSQQNLSYEFCNILNSQYPLKITYSIFPLYSMLRKNYTHMKMFYTSTKDMHLTWKRWIWTILLGLYILDFILHFYFIRQTEAIQFNTVYNLYLCIKMLFDPWLESNVWPAYAIDCHLTYTHTLSTTYEQNE